MMHRIIWDLRLPGVNQLSQCPRWQILPRVSVVVTYHLTLIEPYCTTQPTMIGVDTTNPHPPDPGVLPGAQDRVCSLTGEPSFNTAWELACVYIAICAWASTPDNATGPLSGAIP